MNINLPSPITAYFAADRRKAANVADLFAPDATVKDEGRTITGQSAIQQWVEQSTSTYDFASEPFASDTADGVTIVTSHVTGNFPGSPVDLRYFFKLDGGRIASLEIIP